MEEGLIIEDNVVKECLPDTKTAVIPKNVCYIEDRAFCGCIKLTQIISESPNFASRLGCLYDTEQFRLIATVFGDVTVPREVRHISPYALTNCLNIAFEAGGSFMPDSLEVFDIKSFGYDNEILETVEKESKKNAARAEKEAMLRTATAEALIKHLINKSGLDISTYRVDIHSFTCRDAGITALELPGADCGGVTAVLADEDIAVWKEMLPELLVRIKNGINVADLAVYCRQHNLLPKSSFCRRYAVLSGTSEDYVSEHAESVWIPADIEKNVFFMGVPPSCIIYEGTKQQFSGILAKLTDLIKRASVRSVKCSDGEFELPTMLIESTPQGKVLKVCNIYAESAAVPDGVCTISEGAFHGCSRLASLYLPDSIAEIGCVAFTGCVSLAELVYGGSRSMWRSVAEYSVSSLIINTLLDKVKCADGDEPVPMMDIKSGTMFYCRQDIEVINVPDGVRRIDTGAIKKCECRSIKIPESVHIIKDDAIEQCFNLETAEISGSIKYIGIIFAGCPKLMDITFGGTASRWRSVNKDHDWQRMLNPGAVIRCTDGDIEIPKKK